jgi:hypothetical protein
MRRMHIGAAALLAAAGLSTGAPAASAAVVASLSGAQEVGSGDTNGTGAFAGNRSGANRLCYGYSVYGIAKPAAAHIHRGARGANGPIVVPLRVPSGGSPGWVSGCVIATPALVTEIAAFPARFYVNVHTGPFPDGAIRGQLRP